MIEKFDRIIGIVAFGSVLSIVLIFALSGMIPDSLLPVTLFGFVFSLVGLLYHSINLYRLCNNLKPAYLEMF